MRFLGIDFGERRIGLAISDPAGRLALPLATIERETDRRAIGRIAEIAGREGIERLVVGEPVGLDGERGPAARRARAFAARLAERTGLPCELVDEALTSVAARERLAQAGADLGRGSPDLARIDAVAAQILLQDALDRAHGQDNALDRAHGQDNALDRAHGRDTALDRAGRPA